MLGCFLFILHMITDDINKINYENIIRFLRRDQQRIVDSLMMMKRKNIRRKTIKSSWCNKYSILRLDSGILVYTMLENYLALWPIEYIINGTGNEKVIYIKEHAIHRYQERFLHNTELEFNEILQKFLISFFQESGNKFIIKKESNTINSVSLRFRDGALLGYCYYTAAPGIIRFNTFISDNEIEKANREDQNLLRREE